MARNNALGFAAAMAPPWTRCLGLGLNVPGSFWNDVPATTRHKKYVLRIESVNEKHRFQGDREESLGFNVVSVHEDDRNGTAHQHQEEGSHFWHVRKEQI
jgi:hypothetical protein